MLNFLKLSNKAEMPSVIIRTNGVANSSYSLAPFLGTSTEQRYQFYLEGFSFAGLTENQGLTDAQFFVLDIEGIRPSAYKTTTFPPSINGNPIPLDKQTRWFPTPIALGCGYLPPTFVVKLTDPLGADLTHTECVLWLNMC